MDKLYREELIAKQMGPYAIRETPDWPMERDEILVRVEYLHRRWGLSALHLLTRSGSMRQTLS